MQNERLARAALSRLMEPQDSAGLALVQVAGALDALGIATGQLSYGPALEQEITGVLAEHSSTASWAGLGAALKRWAPRVPDLAPERDLATMQRLGGRLIIPGDDLWPGQLGDLGIHEPICLWWRGVEQELPAAAKSIALVGSRDSTSYGAAVTGDLAYSLAQRGFTVVSGGAYGIDAHAHRAALAGSSESMPTIAVMAGGVDRFYPSGMRTCFGPWRTRVRSSPRCRPDLRPHATVFCSATGSSQLWPPSRLLSRPDGGRER